FSVEMEGVNIRHHPALPVEDSLAAASQMCSENPARLLGAGQRGRIEEGARADILLLELKGEPGAFEVKVHKTIAAGRVSGA
ncbi:MAG: amidohydrolase family protein, partial [Planctomycetota bacterium]|nr:amidohydrolase family protein [Planctomycetota bacterium]